ncbi:MAG: hypothetical protein IID33_05815 [Planctomycetes bacterium]|nr:hypothetical protein [Planctomycetota bacterium]
MPSQFRFVSRPETTTHINIVAITGPGTAFPGDQSTAMHDIEKGDGLENTIVLAEIDNSNIFWSEPRDLDVETMSFITNDQDRPSISCPSWRRPLVCFADGVVCEVSETMPPDALEALTTIAGGENVTREQLIEQGHLVLAHHKRPGNHIVLLPVLVGVIVFLLILTHGKTAVGMIVGASVFLCPCICFAAGPLWPGCLLAVLLGATFGGSVGAIKRGYVGAGWLLFILLVLATFWIIMP